MQQRAPLISTAKRPDSVLRLTLTLLLSVWARSCFACDCMESPLAQRMDWSTDVFIGKVIEVRPLDLVVIEVSESFKGSAIGVVVITVAGSDCDYFLPPVDPKVDESYLVFMNTTAGKNIVSRCLGSGPIESKTEEISVLRIGPTK